MSAIPDSYLSPEEYLAQERRSEYKSEYSDGEMFAMSGASREHNRIVVNLVREISSRLRGSSCEAFGGDMRVSIPLPRKYVYPNVSVVCGESEFEGEEVDTLTNPILVIEVLSPSTESYDRGTKFHGYRRIASLKEYVLVSQVEPRIERFVRRDSEWVLSETEGLEAVLRLESLGCELPLADIYDRVEFLMDAEPHPAPHAPR